MSYGLMETNSMWHRSKWIHSSHLTLESHICCAFSIAPKALWIGKVDKHGVYCVQLLHNGRREQVSRLEWNSLSLALPLLLSSVAWIWHTKVENIRTYVHYPCTRQASREPRMMFAVHYCYYFTVTTPARLEKLPTLHNHENAFYCRVRASSLRRGCK